MVMACWLLLVLFELYSAALHIDFSARQCVHLLHISFLWRALSAIIIVHALRYYTRIVL